MSIEAMQWAFNQDIKPSSVKFVLVSLGDNADSDGNAWPSIAALSKKTGQDRKTVMSAIDRLETLGFISDTGKRRGETGQVKVYRFNFKPVDNFSNSTENGTVPKTEQYRFSRQTVPFFPPNSTVFPPNSTENGTRNPQNPHGTHKEPKYNALADLESMGAKRQTAVDFVALRNKKRAPLTATAIAGLAREAEKAGISVDAAMAMCCERGWTGFKAEWATQPRASPSDAPKKQSRHSGFEKTDYSDGVGDDGSIL